MAYLIEIHNNSGQSYLPMSRIRKTAECVLRGEKIDNAELSIVLTNDKFIKKVNKQFLNHNYATDVISFTLEKAPDLIGELYISVETAAVQARDYGVSLRNELLRLTAHGVLHLSGYEDNSFEKRNIMHKLEDCYIENFVKSFSDVRKNS